LELFIFDQLPSYSKFTAKDYQDKKLILAQWTLKAPIAKKEKEEAMCSKERMTFNAQPFIQEISKVGE
jgi:hypothetical protein